MAVVRRTHHDDRVPAEDLVGRERELSQLRSSLENSWAGRGELILVAGEAGIGKTRLAEELESDALARGACVLWGRGWEEGGAPAYWPWVQIIGSYVRCHTPAAIEEDLTHVCERIARIVPEIREWLPTLPQEIPHARRTVDEADHERFRLFDAVVTFFRRATSVESLTLIFDDLHSADASTLLLLDFLVRQVRETRLFVLGTYRDEEVRTSPRVHQLLESIARRGLRLRLEGWSTHEVARYVQLLSQDTPSESLVTKIRLATEGNPLLVKEVVELFISDGRVDPQIASPYAKIPIPARPGEAIRLRLYSLSDGLRDVLDVAAVFGRHIRLSELTSLCSIPRKSMIEMLDEAVAAGLLLETSPGAYRFSHGLVREVLYEDLGPSKRMRLHRQIGEVLEEMHRSELEPYVVELAHHFVSAAPGGELAKGLEYAERAGQRAMRLLAYDEAAAHFQAAVDLVQMGGAEEHRLCDLLLGLGECLRRAGDMAGSRRTFERAAATARRLESGEALALAALGCAEVVHAPLGTDVTAVELLEEALGVLGEPDSPLRARLLARLASLLYWSDPRERRTSLGREAIALARRLADPETLAFVLREWHRAQWAPDNVAERLDAATELVKVAEAAGDVEMALGGRIWRVADLIELGDLRAADSEIDAFSRSAQELRHPYYSWAVPMWRATHSLLAGRLEEAERLAQEAFTLGRRAHPEAFDAFGVQLTLLRREQGRLDEIEPFIRSFADRTPDAPTMRAGLANMYAQLERLEDTRREFEHLASNNFTDLPADMNWLICLALATEACAILGDAPRAALLHEMLLPYASRVVVVGWGIACYGAVAHYLGLLASTMRRWKDAATHFEVALQMHSAMGAKAFVARTQRAYGEMLWAQGRRTKGLELLAQGARTYRDLGMTYLAGRASARLKELRGQGRVATGSRAPTTRARAARTAATRRPPGSRGELVRGRYELIDVVAKGGQGVVIRARDRVHDRPVALKVRRARSAAARESVLREARVLFEARPHPHLPLLREDFFDSGRYYLVMDWVEGTTLEELLQRDAGHGLSLDVILPYLEHVAVALDHLHAHRPPIVHKDVKPANIVITTEGLAVLVDFGLAHRTDRIKDRGSGTVGYRAPELAGGADPTPQADVFGLAATIFASLTGSPPAPGESRRWRELARRLPSHGEAMLRRSLTVDPSRRPLHASELVASLAAP